MFEGNSRLNKLRKLKISIMAQSELIKSLSVFIVLVIIMNFEEFKFYLHIIEVALYALVL